MSCVVVLKEDIKFDPRILADVFAKELSITPLEAKIMLRKSRGIIARNVDKDFADQVVEILKQSSIEAEAVASENFPLLSEPKKITYAQRQEDMLVYKNQAGVSEAISWQSIECVSVGLIPRTGYYDSIPETLGFLPSFGEMDKQDAEILKDNIIKQRHQRQIQGDIFDAIPKYNLVAYVDIVEPPRLTPYHQPEEDVGRSPKTSEPRLRAEMEPPPAAPPVLAEWQAGSTVPISDAIGTGAWVDSDTQWFRINHESFVYRKSKLSMSDIWAFKYFVKDLIDLCASETVSQTTLQLLQNRDIKKAIMLDIDEFTNYTQWCLYKRRVK